MGNMDLCLTAPGKQLNQSRRNVTNEQEQPQKKEAKKVKTVQDSNPEPQAEPTLTVKIDYSDSYHHRMGSGSLSGNERYNMLVERLEFEFADQLDLLLMSRTNDQHGQGKFDIYINDELHHDSNTD